MNGGRTVKIETFGHASSDMTTALHSCADRCRSLFHASDAPRNGDRDKHINAYLGCFTVKKTALRSLARCLKAVPEQAGEGPFSCHVLGSPLDLRKPPAAIETDIVRNLKAKRSSKALLARFARINACRPEHLVLARRGRRLLAAESSPVTLVVCT